MNEKLYDKIMKLPKSNIVNLMWGALDEMQAYNGRSRQECILLAMGASYIKDGKWKLPPHKTLRENTDSMGL